MTRLPLLPDFPRPLVFAHRGLSSVAPENTRAAFALARVSAYRAWSWTCTFAPPESSS